MENIILEPREGQNRLLEILKNEQKVYEKRLGIKLSLKLLCRLSGIKENKLFRPHQYSQEKIKAEIEKLQNVDFDLIFNPLLNENEKITISPRRQKTKPIR